MNNIYFENIHKTAGHYPYLDFEMENINYISHFHEEIELVYIVSGNVSANTESGTILLKPDDICFFMPGEIHSFFSTQENKLYIFKLFSKTYIENIDFAFIRLKNNVIKPDNPIYTNFLSDIQKIAEEVSTKQPGFEFAVQTYANHIMMLIARKLTYIQIDFVQKKLFTTRLAFLEKVNTYIEINYSDPISLDKISDHCNLSKYYFAHFFKTVTNMSFIEYITLFRLKKAQTMLMLSSESITSIAEKCGFNNTRNFNRMFKKQFGKTPTEYKSKINSYKN